MTNVLEWLGQNDPNQTWIEINLTGEDDDAAIARALQRNPYVSRVELCLAQRDANWNNLYRVLATRGNLEYFILFDNMVPSVPVERIRPILQAIQRNTSVRFVELEDILLSSEDLCSFLDTAVHVTDLILDGCVLTGGERGARDVAGALQRNTSIATLKLLCCDQFLDTVLEGLVSNTCVRNLVLSTRVIFQEAVSNACRGLMESTRSIQRLELTETTFTEQSFHPVAQGLIDSSTVEDITLHACSFNGGRSIHPLNEILRRKQNLRALTFKACIFQTPFSQVLLALNLVLRRTDSPLRRFQFDGRLPNQSFSILCEAVAVSKLEYFSIGRLDTEQHFTALTDAIPSMKIQKLVIYLGHYCDGRRIMQTLRQAVKHNFTLQSVKYQYLDDDDDADDADDEAFLDASDVDQTVQCYLERNIRLARWVEDPATVPKLLWKEATTLAAKAGPETLFRLLRKIGPEVLPVGSRKRKRSG